MAGREGARGYVYQAIIAVLNCLDVYKRQNIGIPEIFGDAFCNG